MSLRKKTTMTPEKIAANKANGERSRGPATPEGRERIRAANTRHGFYSQAEAMALAGLGEDPADLERLRKNLHDDLQPPSGLEKELVEHLVQVVWRWKRAGRMQEGFALRQAKEVNLTRDDRLHAHMMRLKMTEESLRLLAQSVAHEYYVTTPADLAMMKNLSQEGVVKEMAEIALALFYQLQAPGTGEDGGPVDPEEQSRRALARIKAIFGLDGDTPPDVNRGRASNESQESPQAQGESDPRTPEIEDPDTSGQVAAATVAENVKRYPNITAAQWEARERPRQLLENILTRQVELCEAQRKALLKESLAGPTPFERAAEIALAHPNAALMQRMEESSFRQIWRITNLLLKVKRQAREAESWGNPARGQNVNENTAA